MTIEEVFRKYQVEYLYHFTDHSNLDSIKKEGGLYSITELERRGIVVPEPGGNDWSHSADKLSNVDDYVHLAFSNDHPMLYCVQQEGRCSNPVWLRIDADVAFAEGVLFTDAVANKNGVTPFTSETVESRIDFDVLYTFMDWHEPSIKVRRQQAIKSEILVPKFIQINKIHW